MKMARADSSIMSARLVVVEPCNRRQHGPLGTGHIPLEQYLCGLKVKSPLCPACGKANEKSFTPLPSWRPTQRFDESNRIARSELDMRVALHTVEVSIREKAGNKLSR